MKKYILGLMVVAMMIVVPGTVSAQTASESTILELIRLIMEMMIKSPAGLKRFVVTPSPVPTGWQTYRNSQLGFEFQYPANITLKSNNIDSSKGDVLSLKLSNGMEVKLRRVSALAESLSEETKLSQMYFSQWGTSGENMTANGKNIRIRNFGPYECYGCSSLERNKKAYNAIVCNKGVTACLNITTALVANGGENLQLLKNVLSTVKTTEAFDFIQPYTEDVSHG